MIKHGVSHAGVVLASIIAGETITKTFLQIWPDTEKKLVAMVAGHLNHYGIDWPLATVSWITTITLFGFIWGIAFKFIHSDN